MNAIESTNKSVDTGISQKELFVGLLGEDDTAAASVLSQIGMDRLYNMSLSELKEIGSLGDVNALRIYSAFNLIRQFMSERDKPLIVKGTSDILEILKDMKYLEQEHLDVLFLNNVNSVIRRKNIFKGTVNSINVHPRDIFREAYRLNAHSIIIAHNHPSGFSTPSDEDVEFTKVVAEAGKSFNLQLVDHLVIGKYDSTSIRKLYPHIF